MTKQELLKSAEEKFEKVNKECNYAYGTGEFPPEVKKFLLQSIEEAYNLGEENMRERIREWTEKKEKDHTKEKGERKNPTHTSDEIYCCIECKEDEDYNSALSDLLQELNTNK